MRPAAWLRPRSLLCLALCLNIVAAGHLGGRQGLYRRQDEPTPTTASEIPESTTPTDQQSTTVTTAPESTASGDASATATATTTSSEQEGEPTEEPTISQAAPSSINGNTFENSTNYEVDIPPGELPLPPVLTPGWGVAGAILLLTGAGYALIGIKNAWLQTFFSAGYLAALCTSILIVYVTVPPVSNAIQGAYVVAAVCAGLLIGGGATFFRELTEGFGCLLGGFCLAMWLLTLKAGGLLTGSTEKIIFIAVFTVVGYALYFSHYTRGYAMIGLISFGGATVTTLGIDCFSRAGLKEFWAYIWALNDKIFPLGVETYPQTKGITVETALIVLFTVAGVVSQLKLWRVIQDRRAKRAEELEEEQRQRDAEEAQVGQNIEDENKRERQRWEAAHGGEQPADSVAGSGDSSYAEIDNEKKGGNRRSQTTVRTVVCEDKDIELSDLPSSSAASPSLRPTATTDVLAGDEGRITVRVARDDIPEQEEGTDNGGLPTIHEPEENKQVWVMGADGEVRRASMDPESNRDSQRQSRQPGPDIVPLPFRVPQVNAQEDKDDDDDDRSSFATMADDEERSIAALSRRGSKISLGRRLSVNSNHLFRSLSQRSIRAKRKTGEFESPLPSPKFFHSESKEDLVSPVGDSRSVAATMDDMSTDGSQMNSNAKDGESVWSKNIMAELADRSEKAASEFGGSDKPERRQLRPKSSGTHLEVRRGSAVGSINTADEPRSPTIPEEPMTLPEPNSKRASAITDLQESKSKRNSANTAAAKTDAAESAAVKSSGTGNEGSSEGPPKPSKSPVPSTTSTSASLTKDKLPAGLSRIALSYRTNEWAKHLSHADTPEPERLQLQQHLDQQREAENQKRKSNVQEADAAKDDKPKTTEETAAPVNVDDLQQTTESGIPPAAISRAPSAASQVQQNQYASISRTSLAGPPATNASALAALNGQPEQQKQAQARPESTQLQGSHSFRSKMSGLLRRTSSDMTSRTIVEEPATQSPPPIAEQQRQSAQSFGRNSGIVSYNSPQTLLAQREALLRNKSTSLLPHPTIPEETTGEFQQGPPSEFGGSAVAVPPGGSPYRMSHSVSTPLIQQAHNVNLPPPQDVDDLPLAQRRNLMRQSSAISMTGVTPSGTAPPGASIQRSSSAMSFTRPGGGPTLLQQQQQMQQQQRQQALMTAENTNFNSHQPQRTSTLPSTQQRESRLASFRQSVAADLRAGPHGGIPLATQHSVNNGSSSNAAIPGMNNSTNNGDAPLTGLVASIQSGPKGTTTTSNPSGATPIGGRVASNSISAADARLSLEQSRQNLLSQREAEAARQKQAAAEKERSERAFEEMMRSGNGGLMDAHREAMRKMQGNVRR